MTTKDATKPKPKSKASKATKTATPTKTVTKAATKTATKAATKTATKAATKTANVVVTTADAKTEEVAISLTDSFTNLLGQLQILRGQLTSVTGQVRALQKRSDRELKIAQKASKKAKRKVGNRAPSGFVKPTKISLELATFLGKEKGTEMARTEVTREINGYIRLHNLQDPKNGRIILADESLRKLLKLGDKDELTYFNLQRYMSPHFAKKDTKLVEAN
jgi:chromatin remodeling complex protein RSC6